MSNRRDQPFVVLTLISVLAIVAFAFHRASREEWRELPSAKRLIRLAESACYQHEIRTGSGDEWSLRVLAKAHAYSGDITRAMAIVHSLSESWMGNGAAFASCWKIYYDLTGQMMEVPIFPSDASGLEKLDFLVARTQIAMAIATAGRIDDAICLVPIGDEDPYFTLPYLDFYLFAADAAANRKNKDRATAAMRQVSNLLDRLPKCSIHRTEYMLRSAMIWSQLGNKDEVERITSATVNGSKVILKGEETSCFTGRDAARLGEFWSKLDEKDRSVEAFRQALHLADSSFEPQKQTGFGSLEEQTKDYAVILSMIGALQFSAGWRADGAATFDKSLALILSLDANDNRDFQLLGLCQKRGDAGDVEGVSKTITHIGGVYWRAKGHCIWGRTTAVKGTTHDILRHLDEAEALADEEPNPGNQASILVDVAEARIRAEDIAGGKRTFAKAVAASRKTIALASHGWIARAQIRAGLLQEAYNVLGEVHEPNRPPLPLAELAMEVAKREAEAGK